MVKKLTLTFMKKKKTVAKLLAFRIYNWTLKAKARDLLWQ